MFLITETNVDQEITQVELIDVDKIVILYGDKWLKPERPGADRPSSRMMFEYQPRASCGDPLSKGASPRAWQNRLKNQASD